jgi:hypothetical protein
MKVSKLDLSVESNGGALGVQVGKQCRRLDTGHRKETDIVPVAVDSFALICKELYLH